jgi:hypothetical protein
MTVHHRLLNCCCICILRPKRGFAGVVIFSIADSFIEEARQASAGGILLLRRNMNASSPLGTPRRKKKKIAGPFRGSNGYVLHLSAGSSKTTVARISSL